MNLFKALMLVMTILPALTTMIKELENSSATGEEKRNAAIAFAITLLESGGSLVGLSPSAIATIESVLGSVIGALVTLYNAVKLFTHKNDPIPSPIPNPGPNDPGPGGYPKITYDRTTSDDGITP